MANPEAIKARLAEKGIGGVTVEVLPAKPPVPSPQREEKAKANRPTKQQRREQSPPPRLPDGAHFDVTYDASQERWTGTLTVAGKTFTDTHSAVFKLLRRLDEQYRASVRPEPKA